MNGLSRIQRTTLLSQFQFPYSNFIMWIACLGSEGRCSLVNFTSPICILSCGWCVSDPKDSFLASVRPPNLMCVDIALQVSRHFDVYQTKPEMQAEKVQLLATAKVPGKYKTRWLHWWNMSKDSR